MISTSVHLVKFVCFHRKVGNERFCYVLVEYRFLICVPVALVDGIASGAVTHRSSARSTCEAPYNLLQFT
jgi:hypothetical protein